MCSSPGGRRKGRGLGLRLVEVVWWWLGVEERRKVEEDDEEEEGGWVREVASCGVEGVRSRMGISPSRSGVSMEEGEVS